MALPRTYSRREVIRLTSGVLGIGALGPWAEGVARAADPPQNPATNAPKPPAAPVAIARCESYDPAALKASLTTMADQIGGLKSLVAGKTVAIKVNVTGGPGRWRGMSPGLTYHTHPRVVQGVVALLAGAGAARIRILESAPSRGTLEEFLTACDWDIPALTAAGPKVEYENTRNLGQGKKYSRFKVPGGGLIYPAYDLNHAYADADILVSIAKLKTHSDAGVTGAAKNLFGITPNSLYGSEAGSDAGNEDATGYRGDILHFGQRQPPAGVPAELAAFGNDATRRVPRVIVDLVRARPAELSVIDGITSVSGGEGPWHRSLRPTQPHVLLMGRNPICTDAVATAVMGYDPMAKSGVFPFPGDNHLALAAASGVGTNDLDRIEVRGLALKDARCPYGRNA
jgi:uncharacterized protein (DUF362 family)